MTERLERLRLQFVKTELSTRIGQRMCARRKELGLKQREVADRIGLPSIGNQQVSVWERGINRPSDDNLVLIAKALEVDVGYFIASDEPASSDKESPDLMGALGDKDRLARLEAQINQLREDVASSLDAIFDAIERRKPPDDAEDNAANDE